MVEALKRWQPDLLSGRGYISANVSSNAMRITRGSIPSCRKRPRCVVHEIPENPLKELPLPQREFDEVPFANHHPPPSPHYRGGLPRWPFARSVAAANPRSKSAPQK
jgi:hypothetical protein